MDIVAFAFAFLAYKIRDGLHLPWEVTALFGAWATCSLVELISMRVHDGRDTMRTKVIETRLEDASEVRLAVEETVPAAIDAAMPPILKDLSRAPDPYEPH